MAVLNTDSLADRQTLHDKLKSETRRAHHELEAGLNLLRPNFKMEDYRSLLSRWHAFYSSFEEFLHEKMVQHCAAANFYCKDRAKIHWLDEDLKKLGIPRPVDGLRPAKEHFSELFPTSAHLWGAIYVIEGSMLGGIVLSRHFNKDLKITDKAGLRFYTGYGQQTKEKWSELLGALATLDRHRHDHEHVIRGAKNMFSLLGSHLLCADKS
jgi:heme oxygenase (biliverdin-IX-beta and delta-forming)